MHRRRSESSGKRDADGSIERGSHPPGAYQSIVAVLPRSFLIATRAIDQTDQRGAFMMASQIVQHDIDGGFRLRHACNVQRDGHTRMPPKRMIAGKRLRVGHIKHRAANLPGIERIQQIVLL
jgi:hypothetical protein